MNYIIESFEMEIIIFSLQNRQCDIERNSREYERIEKLLFYFQGKVDEQQAKEAKGDA